MATNKRNLEGTNKSKWQNETTKVGLMLDNLIETAEDKPYAYILIAVEKGSDDTNIGVQVNGMGLLLAQGLASFLVKDDYSSLLQAANYLAAQGFMDDGDDGDDDDDDDDEFSALLQSIFGNK